MTADTAPLPAAPATGLFGGGTPAPQAASDQDEPTSTQRKSFADLFRADGTELHPA